MCPEPVEGQMTGASTSSERNNPQNRIAPRAVLRRREGTCFSFPSEDEVGALKGAIRVERAQRAEQSNWVSLGCRRER